MEAAIQAGVYKHYKGGYYQVLGIAQHSETKELMVVYISLSGAHLPGARMRVRPLTGKDGFLTPAEFEEGYYTTRFNYVGYTILT